MQRRILPETMRITTRDDLDGDGNNMACSEVADGGKAKTSPKSGMTRLAAARNGT
jgi:hypothetical protein